MACHLRSASQSAGVAVLIFALVLLEQVASQSSGACGSVGQPCCCQNGDWQNSKCCGQGLQCTMFNGQGFGILPDTKSLCIPSTSDKQQQGCGQQGGPCCMSTEYGYPATSCSNGLMCITRSIGWGSKAQYTKLASGFTAAVKDPAVMGTCEKFTSAQCGKAYMPCGTAIGAAGVTCPGNPAKCPSGFYCAASFDTGTGERCLPLPSNAGHPGGPCLPNNLPDAPIVKFTGKEVAPAFCKGSAVCFMSITGDTTGFTYTKPQQAKTLASRIRSTKCLEVPEDCGAGPGKPCCPSSFGVVTDKPLPSYGKKWQGAPCNNDTAEFGVFCQGSYVALAAEPMGICTANPACGGELQDCCKYSGPSTSGWICPTISPVGSGKGFCTNYYKCRTCPNPLVTVEDVLRCY